jgi:hypothetical protein
MKCNVINACNAYGRNAIYVTVPFLSVPCRAMAACNTDTCNAMPTCVFVHRKGKYVSVCDMTADMDSGVYHSQVLSMLLRVFVSVL